MEAAHGDSDGLRIDGLTAHEDLVRRAQQLCEGVLRSSRDVIRYKFALGGVVRVVLERTKHQHAAVQDLARRLSRECGKSILPQRLYEAARLHEAFGGKLERIWNLERRVGGAQAVPVTYTYLVRQVIPRITREQAWNTQEWEGYEDAKLVYLERAVEQIEALAEATRVAVSGERLARGSADRLQSVSIEGVPLAGGLLTICQQSERYRSMSLTLLVETIRRAVDGLRHAALAGLGTNRSVLEDVRQDLDRILARPSLCAELNHERAA